MVGSERLIKEGVNPDNVDTILARAEAANPRVGEKQDFKDITFTDKFVDKNGKTGTSKVSAQSAYDTAVKKRNHLKRLLDCVNG